MVSPNEPNGSPAHKSRGRIGKIDRERGAFSAPGAELFSRLARRAVLTSERLTARSFIRFVESLPSLTTRERDVLLLFMEHLSDKTVASRLVLCQVWNEGYSRLSLVRASAVVNCQSIFAW